MERTSESEPLRSSLPGGPTSREASDATAGIECDRCRKDLRPGARFCDSCGAPVVARSPPSAVRALPASFADGRYQVKRFLGEGGRKRVYLAQDTRLERDVAIAVVKTDGLDESGIVRIRREARVMGRLGDHPNIVSDLRRGGRRGRDLHRNPVHSRRVGSGCPTGQRFLPIVSRALHPLLWNVDSMA